VRPNLSQRVTIETPAGPPTVDAVTGDLVPGSPTIQYEVPARLSQKPVENISQQAELLATQNTTISFWTVLVGRDTVLAPGSVVTDDAGRKFRIEGAVADRPEHRPTFRAAAARLISDLQ